MWLLVLLSLVQPGSSSSLVRSLFSALFHVAAFSLSPSLSYPSLLFLIPAEIVKQVLHIFVGFNLMIFSLEWK